MPMPLTTPIAKVTNPKIKNGVRLAVYVVSAKNISVLRIYISLFEV